MMISPTDASYTEAMVMFFARGYATFSTLPGGSNDRSPRKVNLIPSVLDIMERTLSAGFAQDTITTYRSSWIASKDTWNPARRRDKRVFFLLSTFTMANIQLKYRHGIDSRQGHPL
jgi:hypothetical protein